LGPLCAAAAGWHGSPQGGREGRSTHTAATAPLPCHTF